MSNPGNNNLYNINKETEIEQDKKKRPDKKGHKDNAEERARSSDFIEATPCKIENLKIRKKKLSKDKVYQLTEDKESNRNSLPVEGNNITSQNVKTHKKSANPPFQKFEEDLGATCTSNGKENNLDLNAQSVGEMNHEDKKLKEIKLEINENSARDVRNGGNISFENFIPKENLSQKQTHETSKAETENDIFKPGNKVSGGMLSSGIARNLGSAALKGSSLPLLLSMPSGTGTGGSGGLSLLPAGLPPGRYVILPSTTSSIPSFSSIATNVSPITVGTKSNLVAQISQPQKSTVCSFTSPATSQTAMTTINTSSVISSQSTAGRPNITEERANLGGTKAYRGRRKSYTAAEKLAMIEAVESGQKKSNVADQFGVAPSTLACILLQKNKIRCEQMKIDMSRRRLRQTRQMPIVPAPSNASSKSSVSTSRSSRRGTEDPFVHFLSPLSPPRPPVFEESPEEIISVPDLNERLGMEGSSSSNKNEGASSSFLTCSPLISSMPGIHEDVMSSGAGPSSSAQNSNENEGDYEEDAIDVKSEPAFNVESEICEEENSQSNTQSSSDRRSHQSSPTPSMIGPYLLKKETHCTTILDQLLRDDTFSDVTLTAEGQSIRAHKIVLCLASAYFRQVLSKESNVQNVIVFRDVKFAELKNLINFIYTGEATVDAADLESFMKTAEMLEVTSLCDGQRNFPKNLLPRTRESETEKTPSSTPSKATFPSTKRSHTFSSAASNGSPPTKSRKTDGKDSSKKSSVIPHPSTSGGGSGTSVPNNSIIEPMTIIKTEPVSEDSVADEDYELRVGADVSFESLTRSPPPLTQPSQVSTDLDENQSPSSDQSPSSSTSLEKVPVGKCPLCPISQPTRNGSEMTKHLYSQHPDKTVFCCESCSRVFLKKGSFEAHKNDCAR